MPCHCAQCRQNPAPTYTEQFRHETEVREIANRDAESIKRYLDGIKEKRGFAAWKKLRADVIEEWKGNDT